MRLRFAILFVAVFALSLTSHAQWAGSYDPRYSSNAGAPGHEEAFLQSAMNYTSAEIEWSRIASAKSTNPDVKALAAQTIQENGPVAGRLVAEAKQMGEKIPDGLSGKYKKQSDKLSGLSGDALDKEYVAALVKVQHDDVGNLIEESRSTKRPGLADFADKTSAQVAARNDKAKLLDKKLGGK